MGSRKGKRGMFRGAVLAWEGKGSRLGEAGQFQMYRARYSWELLRAPTQRTSGLTGIPRQWPQRKLLALILWLANVGHGQTNWAPLQVRDLIDVQLNSGLFSAIFHFSSEKTSGRTWISFVSSFNC